MSYSFANDAARPRGFYWVRYRTEDGDLVWAPAAWTPESAVWLTIGLAEEVIRANQAELMLARSLLFPTLNAGTTLTLHEGTLLSATGSVRDLERDSLYFGAGADVRGAGAVNVPGIMLTSHLGDAFFAPRVARQKVVSSTFDALATRNHILLQAAHAYLALVGAEARALALGQSAGDLLEQQIAG